MLVCAVPKHLFTTGPPRENPEALIPRRPLLVLCSGLLVVLLPFQALASPEEDLLRSGYETSEKESRVKGFGSDAFGAKSARPPMDPAMTRRLQQAKGLAPHPGVTIGNDRLSFSGSAQVLPENQLTPKNTSLPGREESARHFEEDTPMEVHMHYKLDDQASARVAVNQQDETSGTYVPLKKGETVSGAGVFLDLEVEENVNFSMGGEVTSHQSSASSQGSTSSGASMGLKFSF